MGISSDAAIDKKIIEMRKDNCKVLTIHNWLIGWDNFENLDEQVTLAHILNVLEKAGFEVSKREVNKCFDKHYNKKYHGDRLSFLLWLYKTFNITKNKKVEPSQTGQILPIKLNELASPVNLKQDMVEYTNGEKNGA